MERHLAACAACRAIAATLAGVRRVSAAADARDLWPRLAMQLEEAGVRVPLHLPRLSWELAAALAAVVVAPLLVAEPGRLLALMLGML